MEQKKKIQKSSEYLKSLSKMSAKFTLNFVPKFSVSGNVDSVLMELLFALVL